MEKASRADKEVVIREILKSPESTKTFVMTLIHALEMAHEVLYDLTWERGGKIDPINEPYVVALNNIIREILERTNEWIWIVWE